METNLLEIEKAKRYLFGEMSDEEREKVEELFLTDNDLFYDLIELENDLTDRYVKNKLSAADRQRFETSLSKQPERREKVANAAALQYLIREGKLSVGATAANRVEKLSWFKKLADFFHISPMTVGFSAATGVLMVVFIGTISLYVIVTSLSLGTSRPSNTSHPSNTLPNPTLTPFFPYTNSKNANNNQSNRNTGNINQGNKRQY